LGAAFISICRDRLCERAVCDENWSFRSCLDCGRNCGISWQMNVILIDSKPTGDFYEVGKEENCNDQFLKLVLEKKPITYRSHDFPAFPITVENALDENGYYDQILSSDQSRHFLIPN
jgi:hypothetical protein